MTVPTPTSTTTATPPAAALPFDAEELAAAVGDVLAMFGEPVPVDVSALTGADTVRARVEVRSLAGVAGASARVELVVAAPIAAAGSLAHAFFGEVVAERDLLEAVGELANLCAGAIKPLLDDSWVIGIPELGAGERPGDPAVTATAWFGPEPVTVHTSPSG